MPQIQLLVVQPTPFCNIDCRYCYLPDRTNKAVVAETTLTNLFSQVFASGWAADGLAVVWHAGEPLVLPPDFYLRAFGDTGIADFYYRFLQEFWRLAAATPGKFSFIREIDDAVRQVLRPKESTFFNQLVEPFAITSMDWSGNIATFSPELLGLKNADYGDFIL